MSQEINEEERETMNIEGFNYKVHDMTQNGQTYPRFPFIVNIPLICFTPNQLHSFLSRYFQMLRQVELENMHFYNPVTNTPFSVFCGFCNFPHVIDRPLTPAMVQHLSNETIITPQCIHCLFALLQRRVTPGKVEVTSGG